MNRNYLCSFKDCVYEIEKKWLKNNSKNFIIDGNRYV